MLFTISGILLTRSNVACETLDQQKELDISQQTIIKVPLKKSIRDA